MCRHFDVIGIFFFFSAKFWIPEETRQWLRLHGPEISALSALYIVWCGRYACCIDERERAEPCICMHVWCVSTWLLLAQHQQQEQHMAWLQPVADRSLVRGIESWGHLSPLVWDNAMVSASDTGIQHCIVMECMYTHTTEYFPFKSYTERDGQMCGRTFVEEMYIWAFSLPHPTQNISSSTHHIKFFDACMKH
jgi:hypothetical protein